MGIAIRVWLLYLILLPLLGGEGTFPGGVDAPAATLIGRWGGALLGGVILLAAFNRSGRDGLDRPRLDAGALMILAFALWAGLSLVWTVSWDHSTHQLARIGPGALLFLSALTLFRDRDIAGRAFTALVLSTLPLLVYAIFQAVQHHVGIVPDPGGESFREALLREQARGFRPGSFFKDPNTFASYLSVLTPLTLHVLMTARGARRGFFFALLALNYAGLFLVAARGPALLAVGASLLYLFLIRSRRDDGEEHEARVSPRRSFLFLAGGVLVLGLVLHGVCRLMDAPSLIDRLIDPGELLDNALGRRLLYWKAACLAFADHPWIGTGLNTAQQVLFAHLEAGTFTRFPHNLALQMLVELGIPGGLLLMAGAVSLIAGALRGVRTDPARLALVLGFGVLLAYALVDITFQCDAAVFLFFILAGALGGMTTFSDGNRGAKHDRFTTIAVLLVAVLAALGCREAFRTFAVRVELDEIQRLADHATPGEIQRRFETLSEPDHRSLLTARADFNLYRFRSSGNATFLDQALDDRIRNYEAGGRNPCEAYEIAKIHHEANRLEDAETWYGKALKGFPGSLSIWNDYTRLLEATGRDDRLASLLPGLLDGSKEDPGLTRYYAVARFELALRLAALHERNGHRKLARGLYRELYAGHRNVEYLEVMDPFRGKRIRVPLKDTLNLLETKLR